MNAKCNFVVAYAKYANGTMDQNDIINCFRPQCDKTGQYLRKQCSLYFPGYCWCSTPDGHIINDTFQKNMPEGYCGKYLTD